MSSDDAKRSFKPTLIVLAVIVIPFIAAALLYLHDEGQLTVRNAFLVLIGVPIAVIGIIVAYLNREEHKWILWDMKDLGPGKKSDRNDT